MAEAVDKSNEWVATVTALVEPIVVEIGCSIHELTVRLAGREFRIGVVIDTERGWEPGRGVTIEQTSHVARQLNYLLETENKLGADYTIEVSSPGIERSLTTAEHFVRNAGQNVHIVVRAEPGQRAVYDGRLEGVVDGSVVVTEAGGTTASISLASIRKARTTFDFSVYDRQPKGARPKKAQKKPAETGNEGRHGGEGTT